MDRLGRFALVGVLFAAFAAVCLPTRSLALAQEPLSKLEARSLPPSKVKRRVLEQLGATLLNEPAAWASADSRRRPTRPLRDLWYWMKPRATWMPGLCSADRLIFKFDPATQVTDGADAPMKVTGLEAGAFFHLREPVSESNPDGISATEKLRADIACRRLNPYEDHFFAADDDETALYGFWLLQQLRSQVDKQPDTLALTCGSSPPVDRSQCLAWASSITTDSVDSIEACRREALDVYTRCAAIQTGGLEVRLYSDTRDAEERLVRAAIEQTVIIADTLID